jgi:hypothetical protein
VKLDPGAHVFYAFGFALKSGCDSYFPSQQVETSQYKKARAATNLNVLFQLPLSPEAHQQLLQLAILLDNLGEEIDELDIWTYSWGCPFYSSQKA